jgi:hypothetical protein
MHLVRTPLPLMHRPPSPKFYAPLVSGNSCCPLEHNLPRRSFGFRRQSPNLSQDTLALLFQGNLPAIASFPP